MTQRERLRDDEGAVKVGVYDTPGGTARTAPATIARNVVEADQPTDLIRWGPVFGGLFAALATLISLAVLGIAIGLSTFDANNITGAFGIGAGVWGALTALLAFLVGGWIAGKAAAFSGRTSGIMNGAMVWFVAIPMLVYLLAGGIGALARTAGGVAGTAVQAGAAAAGGAGAAAASNPAVAATAQAGTNAAGDAAANAAATAQAAIDNVSPQDVNNAADTAANGAWGTLLSLGLTAAAAIAGGYLGARSNEPKPTARRA